LREVPVGTEHRIFSSEQGIRLSEQEIAWGAAADIAATAHAGPSTASFAVSAPNWRVLTNERMKTGAMEQILPSFPIVIRRDGFASPKRSGSAG
jgi:hypothetical protein